MNAFEIESGAGSSQSAATRAVLHAGFVVTGAVTTLLGPLLPLMISRWSLADSDAGLFFTLQFCGNVAGMAALGILLARRGYRFALSLGFVLMAAGVAGLLAAGTATARISTFIYGCGLGLTISGINLWVGEDSGPRPAAALSLLNMAWGVGAIAFPPLVLLANRADLLLGLMLGLAALCGFLAIYLAIYGQEPRTESPLLEGMDAGDSASQIRSLAILGSVFFVYVGTEAAVSGWTATLAKRMGTSSTAGWTLVPMFFWAGLLSGRGLVPLGLRAVSELGLLMAGLSLAAVGTGALLAMNSFSGVATCAAIAGLGMACVYPLLVAWMLTLLGQHARRRANVMFALGCAGGATLPWLVGFVSTRAESLQAGLLVPLAGCLSMPILLSMMRRRSSD